MKISLPIDTSNLKVDDPQYTSYTSQLFSAILQVLNGEITFNDNCKTTFLTVVFNSANVQQSLVHGLNKIPMGYILVGSKVATQLYDGTTPSSAQAIYLKSTVATTARVLIF